MFSKYIKLFFLACLIALSVAAVGCAGTNGEEQTAVAGTSGILNVADDTPVPVLTAEPTAFVAPSDTPEPTAAPTDAPKIDPNPGFPYYLYVEKGSFTITIYSKDENFEYTVVERQYRIGHGGNKTPTGLYQLSSTRHRWHTFRLGGSVQYASAYYGNLYIHSPLYGSENPWAMWPKYYNGEYGIGTDHTGGCLRMVTEAAKFIYENCPDGTTLEIVNGSPRGTTSEEVPPMTTYGIDPTDVEVTGGGN